MNDTSEPDNTNLFSCSWTSFVLRLAYFPPKRIMVWYPSLLFLPSPLPRRPSLSFLGADAISIPVLVIWPAAAIPLLARHTARVLSYSTGLYAAYQRLER